MARSTTATSSSATTRSAKAARSVPACRAPAASLPSIRCIARRPLEPARSLQFRVHAVVIIGMVQEENAPSVTSEFDYVIVGAGSAGCVLANRLSAGGKHSVLLL